ncbi:hypothetical protein ABK040_008328 [Willaertia magna]
MLKLSSSLFHVLSCPLNKSSSSFRSFHSLLYFRNNSTFNNNNTNNHHHSITSSQESQQESEQLNKQQPKRRDKRIPKVYFKTIQAKRIAAPHSFFLSENYNKALEEYLKNKDFYDQKLPKQSSTQKVCSICNSWWRSLSQEEKQVYIQRREDKKQELIKQINEKPLNPDVLNRMKESIDKTFEYSIQRKAFLQQNSIPWPRNSFILFKMDNMKELKEKYIEEKARKEGKVIDPTTITAAEMNGFLAEAYHALSNEEKATYKKRSMEERLRYYKAKAEREAATATSLKEK